MEKNELKNLKKELETSIEKLGNQVDCMNKYGSIACLLLYKERSKRLKRELEMVQWMIDFEESLEGIIKILEQEGFSVSGKND